MHGNLKKRDIVFNAFEHIFIGTIIFIQIIKRLLDVNQFYKLIDQDIIYEKAIDLVIKKRNIKQFSYCLVFINLYHNY